MFCFCKFFEWVDLKANIGTNLGDDQAVSRAFGFDCDPLVIDGSFVLQPLDFGLGRTCPMKIQSIIPQVSLYSRKIRKISIIFIWYHWRGFVVCRNTVKIRLDLCNWPLKLEITPVHRRMNSSSLCVQYSKQKCRYPHQSRSTSKQNRIVCFFCKIVYVLPSCIGVSLDFTCDLYF